ncbi:U6 snRNA phosphodiesterase Usb1 [Elaphomyces granulatus]
MALVQYPDSDSPSNESSDKDQTPPRRPLKRTRKSDLPDETRPTLPPLPTSFHDLYASGIRLSTRDDPSLHEGRIRAIPHVEGNWPSHIYLEWYPSRLERSILNDILSQCENPPVDDAVEVRPLLQSDLGAQLPLHISLSRPCVLTTDQRQPFIQRLEDDIRGSGIRPPDDLRTRFHVTLEQLDWVANAERTRWFLVLRVRPSENNDLYGLLRISNQLLAAFGQPPLYQVAGESLLGKKMGMKAKGSTTGTRRQRGGGKPSHIPNISSVDYSACFHVSIAWALVEPSLEQKHRLATIDLHQLTSIKIQFSSVKVKMGNQVLNLALSTLKLDTSGFGGL